MKARVLGVAGGMGGLASAAFASTLYRRWASLPEQDQPVVHLRSNPRLPDRTTALRNGTESPEAAALAAALAAELQALQAAGARRMVVCCVTAHAVLPHVPAELRTSTISLLDLLFEAQALPDRRRLVLCTDGTRRLQLLERHPRFANLSEHFIFPDDTTQAEIHRLIYTLKAGAAPTDVVPIVGALARQAGAKGLIAACTEMHLLGALPEDLDCVDPLVEIANRLEFLLG